MQRIKNLLPQRNINKLIIAITAWQFLSVVLMAVGTWPPHVAVLSAVLLGMFIIFAKPYYSVLLLILSIPFYVILPNPFLANFPMWRILFILLFAVWSVRLLILQRAWLLRLFVLQKWGSLVSSTGAGFRATALNALRRMNSRLMPWDKVAILFFIIALFSLMIARFPIHGVKQILFVANIYAFYLVIINVVTDQAKVKELIRYTTYSLGIIVGLGFVQYIGTLFSVPYYFWQYWALMVSGLYYGLPLANVLAYSNSWFSDANGTQALRMFGILPDTHAFGVMALFLLGFLVPHLKSQSTKILDTLRTQKWYVLMVILLASFAIMASGTRGVWVAMLGPAVIAVVAYWQKLLRPFLKIMLAVYVAIIALFILSPFISQALNVVRTVDVDDNFLNRAGSIYDLKESSNVGRLEIWQESLKYATLHPFGVGYGNFIVSIVHEIPKDATFDQVSNMKNLRYNLPQGFVTAHSLYLQLLVELGFAGLLAFILFWWEYFERLWLFINKYGTDNNQYTNLSVSLALSFLWLLAYGVFDVTILNDRVLQYMFVCLAISGLIFAKYQSFESDDVHSASQP